MILPRKIHRTVTYIPRAWHRRGFGVQSPYDYELVRDVLFERLSYYAYEDQNLRTRRQRLLYRLKLRFGDKLTCAADDADDIYERVASSYIDGDVLFVERISGDNVKLWRKILKDQRARVTYDLGSDGLVLFDSRRCKQNYLL